MSRPKKDALSMREYMAERLRQSRKIREIGGPIFDHVAERIGDFNAEYPTLALSHKVDVSMYGADITADSRYYVYVTLGIYAVCMKELVVCLPREWPVRRFYGLPVLPETFPVCLLREMIAALIRKNSKFRLAEGIVLSRTKKPWSKLDWPDGVSGVTLVEHNWPGDDSANSDAEGETEAIPEDEVLTFFTLMPYACSEKELTPAWYDAMRDAQWEKTAFPYDARIALRERMNQAVDDNDCEAAAAALADGADINGRFYYEHNSFGWCEDGNYLERVCIHQNMASVRFFIEHGASVPPDLLALIAGWCSPDDVAYCLDKLKLDVNALDRVEYTALDRATAFENTETCRVLEERGGRLHGRLAT